MKIIKSIHPLVKVWLGTFIYCLSIGLIIQLIILPYITPKLHGGYGLLAARDWIGFHEMAVTHANTIADFGWSHFRLRPDGDNAIVGILSILYFLFSNNPYVLLPINAFFYASAATALFSIIRNIGLTNKHSLLCIAPLIFFPSAALEYAQIHKDVFCTAGFLVSIACIVKLSSSKYSAKATYFILGNIVALGIIWIFRPYYLTFFILFYILMIIFYGTIFLKPYLPRFIKLENNTELFDNRDSFYKILYSLILSLFAIYYSNSHFDFLLVDKSQNLPALVGVEQAALPKNASVVSAPSFDLIISDSSLVRDASKAFTTTKSGTLIAKSDSSNSTTVDSWFDKIAFKIYVKLAVARRGFITSGVGTAATNIDQHIDFNNIDDAIAYIPRALQVSLLTPFPSQWFDFNNRNSSSAEIFLSSAEMVITYICFAGWLYWLFSFKSISASLLIPSFFCLIILLALGMSVANVGTIYRMRFPFEMVMISFGIAGWIKAMPSLKNFFLRRA